MRQHKSLFERYLEAVQNTGDIMLRLHYQKNMMKASLLDDKEIDRVAERVLSRISATVDMTDVFEQVKELRDLLDSLGT